YNTTADECYTYDGNDDCVPKAMKDAILRYLRKYSINNIVNRYYLQDNEQGTRAQQATAINNLLLK
ncbi:hypothetical protein, partial [Pseudoalteromonas ruthenica]|uniref:hypothetical protein n=1 Tax=Pseudoalteromonas ruthenica TaxID=151081 RepID=UPI001BB1D156